MNTTETPSRRKRGLAALIETLSEGYQTVLRQIWLIAIPIALDVYLWLGPRLSVRPLTRSLLSVWLPLAQIPADMRPFFEANRQFLETLGQEVNLFSLLSSSLLGMPSYLSGGLPERAIGSPVTWGEQGSALAALTLVVLLTAAGLFLGCIYLGAIAQVARSGIFDPRRLLLRVWRYWGLILLFGVLLVGAVLAAGLPMALIIALAEAFSPALARFTMFAALGLMFWMLFHLFFVPHAIVLSESNLFHAIWNSLIIIARNFWSALGLVILINLINAGFNVIWRRMSVNAPLMAVSIAGNAFIGTGLVAASLIFYQDRLEQWSIWLERTRLTSRNDNQHTTEVG